MANYNITQIKTRQVKGANLTTVLDTFNSRTLIISPKPGYVVSSSNFNVPGNLPYKVDSINLSDTGEPGELGNTVKVLVVFQSNYVVNTNTTISLGLTGDADLYLKPAMGAEYVDVNFYLKTSEQLSNCTVLRDVESNFISTSSYITGEVRSSINTLVATYIFKADEGTKFRITPYLNTQVDSKDYAINLKVVDIIEDYDGNIISYEIQAYFFGKSPSTAFNDLTIDFIAETINIEVKTREVHSLTFYGSTIGVDGANRQLIVNADVGAKWNLTVEKVGSPNVVLTSLTNVETIHELDSTASRSSRFKVNDTEYDNWLQEFPSTLNASESYEITITGVSGTALGSNVPATTPTYTIVQTENPTIDFAFSSGQPGIHYDIPATISVTGRPDTYVSELPAAKQAECVFSLDIDVQTDVGYTFSFTPSQLNIWGVSSLPQHNIKKLIGSTSVISPPGSSGENVRIHCEGNGLLTGSKIVQEDYDDVIYANRIIWGIDDNTGSDPDDLGSNVEFVNTTTTGGSQDPHFTGSINESFTFIGTSWSYPARWLPGLNGGTELSMNNVVGSLSSDSRTFNLKADIVINKFGSDSLVLGLNLHNVIVES